VEIAWRSFTSSQRPQTLRKASPPRFAPKLYVAHVPHQRAVAAHRNAAVGVEALRTVGFSGGHFATPGGAFERSTGSFAVERGRKNPAVRKKVGAKNAFRKSLRRSK